MERTYYLEYSFNGGYDRSSLEFTSNGRKGSKENARDCMHALRLRGHKNATIDSITLLK